MDYMDQLPNENLIEIFEYLDGKDILVMFLVSKRCNQIISKNSTLMGKIKVVFDFNKIQESSYALRSAKRAQLKDPFELFHIKRNYQVLVICNMKKMPDESTMQLFKKFEKIKILTLENCQSTGSSLRPILEIWKGTLHKVEIENVFCSSQDRNLELLEFDNLRELTFQNSNIDLLRNFTNSKLNNLQIVSNFVVSGMDDVVINFLTLQANLKVLKLMLTECPGILMKTDLSSVQFQLDSLICFELIEVNQELINCQKFLKSQAKSLKNVTFAGYCSESLCNIFLNEMPKLKTLNILTTKTQNEFNGNDLRVNTSIEVFGMSLKSPRDSLQNIIKFMKNLQQFNLENGNVKFLFEADLKLLKVMRQHGCTADESVLNDETGRFESLQFLQVEKIHSTLLAHLIKQNPQLNAKA